MKSTILISLVFFNSYLIAQEVQQNTDKETLDYSGSRDFISLYQNDYGYQRFFQEFAINNDWLIRAELLQMKAGDVTTFEFPILVKHRVTERFSVLFGPKLDALISPRGTHFGTSFKIGVEYDMTRHWNIEGGFEYQLKSVFPKGHYKQGSKGSFHLGTGLKF